MKILVIGGSLFVGRVFVMKAREQHEITVVNRGNHPLLMDGVREIVCDRHDMEKLRRSVSGQYDVLIDFCAYLPNDISTVFDALHEHFGQYIFISTTDVLRRGTGLVKDESAPYEERHIPGKVGEYIAGKIALEKELRDCAHARNIPYTIVRPATIYGPYNYAPREAYYAREINVGRGVLYPQGAEGKFQFVYVGDVAKALLALSGNPKAENETFHLCAPDEITYPRFFAVLKTAAPGMQIETVPAGNTGNAYFPFPVTAAETELCTAQKLNDAIGMTYAPFDETMTRTMRQFIEVYR